MQEKCKSYKIMLQIFLQVLARSVQDFSILARKASFLVQDLQDLVQNLARLARKILARRAMLARPEMLVNVYSYV